MRSLIRARAAIRLACVCSFVSGCLLLSASPIAAVTIRTVAITGEVAPDTGGATYTTFGLSTLNESGRVAYTALLAGGGVDATNDLGVWSEGSGSLALVARRGSPAPGTTGDFQSFIAPPILSDAGGVTFRGFLQTGGGITSADNEGLWSGIPGGVTLVAREGSQGHGVSAGQNYASTFGAPAASESHIAYDGSLVGGGVTTSDNRALWAGDPSAPSLVARKGDVAAGVGDGALYESFSSPVVNASGTVAFRAPLDVGDDALFTGSAGSLSLLAREGDPAHGTGGTFASFQSPDLNDNGTVAFGATLDGVPAGADRGIWAGTPGSVSLLALEGDAAPGAGANFASFDTPLLNESDGVAFRAFLDDGGTGVFQADTGGVTKVAATGDAAPDTSANFSVLLSPAQNDSGQVAFKAVLEAVLGVTAANDEAIFATDAAGALQLIAREGDLFERRPGDFAVITGLDLFVDPESRGRSLNDASGGQLTFHLNFADGGEGIFVATIPEPGTGLLLGAALAALGAARRRGK